MQVLLTQYDCFIYDQSKKGILMDQDLKFEKILVSLNSKKFSIL